MVVAWSVSVRSVRTQQASITERACIKGPFIYLISGHP